MKSPVVAYTRTGELNKADLCLRTAVRLDPDDTHAWNHLAICLAKKGDEKGEKEALQRLVSAKKYKSLSTLYSAHSG